MNKQERAAARKDRNDFVKSFGFQHKDVGAILRAVSLNDREKYGKALEHAAKGERISDEQFDRWIGLQRIFDGTDYHEASPLYDDKLNLVREASPEWFELGREYDALEALYYAGDIIDAVNRAQERREWRASVKAALAANPATASL